MRWFCSILASSLALTACGGDSPAVTDATPDDPAAGAAGLPAGAAAAPEEYAAMDHGRTAATEDRITILEQEFAYGATDERNFVGFFAMPEQVVEPLPGIVLVHEWWGLNDNIRERASELARTGYAVLAVDLYDSQVTDDPDVAGELMREVNADRPTSLDNIGQAIDYLRAYALAPRVAVIGLGLGGELALAVATSMPEKIDAVVSYYGRLPTDDAALRRFRAPLLGFYAERDPAIPTRDVQRFRATLWDLGTTAEVLIQIGARHGFADPQRPVFDAAQTEEAWSETIAFLDREIVSARR